ncbi:hypothetical protein [Synechocystis sp. LKSZ1]|uniref:hypothetical protein n=1 Tax=Synechocystis sp. LKSZ1 TaxID=3144951 RepID=UPI00336BCE3F
MKLIPYVLTTLIFYVFSLVRLKARTEQEKIGSTPVVFNVIIFFAIFEFFFIESILTNPFFHVLGFLVALGCSLSIYFYLKNLKKDFESIFYKLVQQSQGKVSILTFMQRTELSLEEATEFLEDKRQQLGGDSYETLGNIYYEFYRW